MKRIKILAQLSPCLILLIMILSFKFARVDWKLYEFFQPLIDDLILLIFLLFMLVNTKDWHWFSKRILYSLFFVFFLNTYTRLFGMDSNLYFQWYYVPLIAMIYSMTISSAIEITYKLYTLWKDGKIKFF